MTSLRDALIGASGQPPHHAGLAMSRYIAQVSNDEAARQAAVRQAFDLIVQVMPDDAYHGAVARWRSLRDNAGAASRTFEAKTAGSLAIGLGGASVTEVGLTVHHTYGMPIIPASALKGLCVRGFKAWAEGNQIDVGTRAEYAKVLFGDTTAASHFVFWDAWYVPGNKPPFHRDTVTVHHPRYYQSHGAGDNWPLESEDPTPIPFIVVHPGSKFLFSLDAPSAEWAAFAEKLLRWCLANLGVGAKTNAGYGYFDTRNREPEAGENEVDARVRHIWLGRTLVYRPNDGQLSVDGPEGKKAFEINTSARAIREQLPVELQDRIKKKKSLFPVTVEVEQNGNSYKILSVTPEGASNTEPGR